VTKPTTINAITDMPAKIPRPIGSTEIFFPGIWKADSAVEDGEEEALSATVTGDVPLLDVDLDFGEIAPVIDGKVGDEVVVGVESGVEVGSGTVESPSADTPGSIELVDVVADEDGEERETDDKDVEAMELVDAVSELLGGWEPGTTTHFRTTCTRGSPFDPLIGVSVMVHVSVTGPELVSIVCTVSVTTVWVSGLPFSWRRKSVSVEGARCVGADEAWPRRVKANAARKRQT